MALNYVICCVENDKRQWITLDESSDLLIVLKWENSSLLFWTWKVLAASSSDTPCYPHPLGAWKGISYSSLSWKWDVLPAATGLFDNCLLFVPVHCILLWMGTGARWCLPCFIASYHFEGILKASLPSTDENLSCSSGIEVQCSCLKKKKRGFGTSHGEDKNLCMCVDRLPGGLGKYDRGD